MGADFLCAIVEVPGVSRGRIEEEVGRLSPAVLQEIGEFYEWRVEYDALVEDDDEAFYAAVRNAIVDAIREVFDEDGTPADSHEIGVVRLRGQLYVLTGGMSWGDSPSDIFDAMSMLAVSGVCDPDRYLQKT